MESILTVYYSFSGATKAVAESIALLSGCDLMELAPETPYSFASNTAAREVRQEIERGFCPRLVSGSADLSKYGTIFVGTPNWFKSVAPPVLSFLRYNDFSGKTIVPFCTHGGGGFGQIETRMAEQCPDAKVLKGFAVTGEADTEELRAWLKAIGILEE